MFQDDVLLRVPERSLLIASGSYTELETWDSPVPTAARDWRSFDQCTIRPLPDEWQDDPRRFEVLPIGASRGGFKITIPQMVTASEIVWAPHEFEEDGNACVRCAEFDGVCIGAGLGLKGRHNVNDR